MIIVFLIYFVPLFVGIMAALLKLIPHFVFERKEDYDEYAVSIFIPVYNIIILVLILSSIFAHKIRKLYDN